MAKRIAIVSAVILIATALPGFAKDTTYRDARSPSWSVLVPDGWTASRTDQGVTLNHATTSAIVWVVQGSRPAADVLSDVGAQFQKQAKDFRQIERGECQFGGEKGAYMVFSGISPNGTPEISRLVSMTNGQMVYTMLLQTRPEQYDDEKRTWQRIQDSFSPEAPVKSVDDREKLDALYAAGVINQQEYEARKKNLGGNGAAQAAASGTGNTAGQSPSSNNNTTAQHSGADAQKLAALDQAYRSGVLTPEEYESKKRQLESPSASGGSSNLAASNSGTTMVSSDGTNQFRAPDNTFSTIVPAGWTAQRTWSGAQPTDVFSPVGGGDARITITAVRAMIKMQQMAAALNNVTMNIFPGLRPEGPPVFGQINNNPTAELRYQGTLANGTPAGAWCGVLLFGGKYYSVFSIARLPRSAAVEADAHLMFRNLQPGSSR